jgi:hypothetical protein
VPIRGVYWDVEIIVLELLSEGLNPFWKSEWRIQVPNEEESSKEYPLDRYGWGVSSNLSYQWATNDDLWPSGVFRWHLSYPILILALLSFLGISLSGKEYDQRIDTGESTIQNFDVGQHINARENRESGEILLQSTTSELNAFTLNPFPIHDFTGFFQNSRQPVLTWL